MQLRVSGFGIVPEHLTKLVFAHRARSRLTTPCLPRSEFDPGGLIYIFAKDFRETFLLVKIFHVIDANSDSEEMFFH